MLLCSLAVTDLRYDLLRVSAIPATVAGVRYANYCVYIDGEVLFASASEKAICPQPKLNSGILVCSYHVASDITILRVPEY